MSIHNLNSPKIAKNACLDMNFGIFFFINVECSSMNVVWNAFHIDSERLPFSLNVDSERPEKIWESEGTKCMET